MPMKLRSIGSRECIVETRCDERESCQGGLSYGVVGDDKRRTTSLVVDRCLYTYLLRWIPSFLEPILPEDEVDNIQTGMSWKHYEQQEVAKGFKGCQYRTKACRNPRLDHGKAAGYEISPVLVT
jgi:hypothetical protein